MPPQIHTYHCICTSLLLASTHILSDLRRRSSSSSNSSNSPTTTDIILPLPSSPPTPSTPSSSPAPTEPHLPPSGYTLLLAVDADKNTTIIRREDGFEKRVLYRCSRCRVVVGYEIVMGAGAGGEAMEGVIESGKEKGKGREEEEVYRGQVIYLLPGGVQSTEAMMGKRRIGEEDVGIRKGVAVFE